MLADPVLDTLLLPFATGDLAWPERGQILFLRARFGAALQAAPGARFLCRQSYLPFAQALAAAGYALDRGAPPSPVPGPFPLVLALPPRQREEARALLAEAVLSAETGGIVVAALANTEGAKSVAADLATLAGGIESRSKHKCRVFWARIEPARIDQALIASWRSLIAPREIVDPAFPGGRFWSRPGLFAWDRVDPGSALLARHLPADLVGHGADLGCGTGYLAAAILTRCPGVTALDLYEAEQDALNLAQRNLAPLAPGRGLDFFWHDVTQGLAQGRRKAAYDFIVSNPPFHVSRADRADLGQAFIGAAAKALKPGGIFLLVANRHLPYEQSLSAAFARMRVLVDESGYKVIEAKKA
jgi:16S rRNA (guanine1207-N2)-methyltransferase